MHVNCLPVDLLKHPKSEASSGKLHGSESILQELLKNPKSGHTVIEASEIRHAHQIRSHLAIILTTCVSSDPKDLWKNTKRI
ncbi:hypothetical protein NPIL_663811 [Nephila pilipes]|uniref:Uncharacterized protein n=1 Tax=Nephila pilipes TaxID=299642 RepID=A0A8X6USC5_NEPPI|nr:hypothetical protein NPIL_663811 [Nephila pilipes]